MNRKRLLLAILIGVLILSLGYAFWTMPRQEKAPRPAQPAPAAKRTLAEKSAPAADRLHLDLLDQEQLPFPGADRDIFRFRGRRMTFPVVAPVTVAPPVQVEPPPPPPPPTPEEQLRAEVARLTLLGFLEKGGQKRVFLSEGGEVFIVKGGDQFGKSKALVAKEIGDKQLVVGWVHGPETVRMDLLEREAHKPAVFSGGAAPGRSIQQTPAAGLRPGRTAFPARRIAPPREIGQPVMPPESQGEGGQGEDVQQNTPVQDDVQPPEDGVNPEELPDGKLPSGDGNGTKQ